jgi:hypothetical protein
MLPSPPRTGGRVRRLLGAVMLGVGAIFQPKVRPGDHWSKSPKLTADVEFHGEAAGGEDDVLIDRLAQIEPMPLRPERPGRRGRRMWRWSLRSHARTRS